MSSFSLNSTYYFTCRPWEAVKVFRHLQDIWIQDFITLILGPCCLRVSLKTALNSWRCLCLSFGVWCAWWDNTPKYCHIGFQHLNGVILWTNSLWYLIVVYGCKFLEGFMMTRVELVEIQMFGLDCLILIYCSFSTYSYNFCILYSVGLKNMEVL